MKIAILLILSFISGYTYAGPLDETRCCITPARTESGEILRRADVLRAFQKIHPCPSTGLKTGACPGWQRDHVLPLACGGFDIVSNIQWLPVSIKTAAGTYAKDRFERKIYCEPMELVK
jgi:hypothetical protein